MDTYSASDAKAHRSKLLNRNYKVETILVQKHGKLYAHSVPFNQAKKPLLGLVQGKLPPIPDGAFFSANPEIEAMSYGGRIFLDGPDESG